MTSELRDILFLDIETVGAAEDFASLDERFKTLWARKAAFFKRDEGQTAEDMFGLRAGIYAEFGRIIVIAVGKYFDTENGELGLKTRYFAGDDEKEILTNFRIMLEKQDPVNTRLCAHNGKEFDFPYLCRRMLVNEMLPPALLNQTGRKPWEVTHLDTMDMWKFGDYKNYTSLDLLAALFNVETSKGVMDGSMVNDVFYKDKDLKKIAEYCVGDVVAIGHIYLKLKGLGSLKAENIIHT
ncbi:MAG TPA: 3'-5' exonuclease [Cyclobacteriaceae bacterium]|nr:3'-5' exonuclease [Cyclobacteriaceae bacterium]